MTAYSPSTSIPISPRSPVLRIERAPHRARAAIGERIAFVLMLCACAVLFIRPTELIPSLQDWPIYEVCVGIACIIGFPIILDQAFGRWRERPVNVCVLGLLAMAVISHLAHAFIWGARHSAQRFGKQVIVYLLVVGLLRNTDRFRKMLACLNLYIIVLTVLALLQYHGVTHFTGLGDYLSRGVVDADTALPPERLSSIGIFNDPNDLCLILLFGEMLSLYWARASKSVVFKIINCLAAAMFLWALQLTQSRGGFLALVASLATLAVSRFGWKRSLLLIIPLAPLLLYVFAGRQTQIDTSEGTGLARLQLWSEALTRIRQAPIFGIGMDQFEEQLGQVVHNSYLQCYVELGFIGGTFFIATFLITGYSLWRLGRFAAPNIDPSLRPIRPYLLATLIAYVIGYMSITRSYTMPMYLLLAILVSYIRLATPAGLKMPQLSLRLAARISALSLVFLAGLYLFVRVFVRWG